MKRTILLFLLFLGSFVTFFSCIDLDTEDQNLPDVYICSKVVDGDTLYALGGYVTSNTTMKSVTMKSPDGSFSADFQKMDYYGYYFEKKISEEDFVSQKPVKGYYKFEITYDDLNTCDTSDYLSTEVLSPIKIEEVKPNSENQSIGISWVKNSIADYYIVRIFRNDSVIYISNNIDPGYSSMNVYAASSGWTVDESPETGDSLSIMMTGVLIESSVSEYAEFQSVSFSSGVGVVWPQ